MLESLIGLRYFCSVYVNKVTPGYAVDLDATQFREMKCDLEL